MSTINTSESNTRIETLTAENFPIWHVDIRARLRSKKLWQYTQQADPDGADITDQEESTEATPLTKKQKEWLEKAQDAADVMTPTISPIIKEWFRMKLKYDAEHIAEAYRVDDNIIAPQFSLFANYY